ncbi:MAG: mechanosensitive ion channel family protein [Bacteroidota bacterium]
MRFQDAASPQDAPFTANTVTQEIGDATNLVLEEVVGWTESAIRTLPNLLVALLVLGLFVLIAKLVRKGVRRGLAQVSQNRQVNNLISTIVYVGVVLAGSFVALGILELEKTVTSLLAGLGVLGLALGFAFQDIMSNFVSGVLLAFRRPFKEGDLIKTNDIFGKVQETNLRSTLIEELDGQLVYMPNASIFTNPITNFSSLGRRRVTVSCGVSYDDDLEKAQRVAMEAVEDVPGRMQDRPVECIYEEFGGSSINFILRFWIDFSNKQGEFLDARSEAIIRVKQAFDKESIGIPFPIRTLDFGDNTEWMRNAFGSGEA